MKYGINATQFQLLERLVIMPLKINGAEVFIFGSRVSGTHHPHSDVDILYRLPRGKVFPAGMISTIKEQIEESRFPFAVDLVAEDDLANSYRDHVLNSMQRL